MSGLCGWFSHEPGALPIAQMAAPLTRFNQSPLRCAEHKTGAVALVAGPDSGSLYHEDGLLIAMWGERAEALARLWRSHGSKACAAFAGSFAFAILDERRDEAMIAVDRSAGRPLFSRHFKTEHRERALGPSDVADAIPRLAAGFDQPCGDPAVVATFHAAELARADGVPRLLGGHGGAVLFGGREHYARQARYSNYESISSALRQTLIEPVLFQLARGLDGAPLRRARGYIEQALVPLPERLSAGNLLQGYGAAEILDPGFVETVDPTGPMGALTQSWWLADGYSQVNQMIALDMKYALADQDLPVATKACELAGVEIAFPYLNDAVVAFAARLAPHQKLDGTRLRPFFREALHGTVPRRFASNRPRAPLPFGHWLQTDARLRTLAFDSLNQLKARHIVRPEFIDELLARRVAEHPARHGQMVWVLMMLEQWFAQRKAALSLAFQRGEHETLAHR